MEPYKIGVCCMFYLLLFENQKIAKYTGIALEPVFLFFILRPIFQVYQLLNENYVEAGIFP